MGVFTLHASNIKGIASKFVCSRPVWIGLGTHCSQLELLRASSTQDSHAQRKQMRPVDVNGSVHTGHKQHQRNFACAQCGLDLEQIAVNRSAHTAGMQHQRICIQSCSASCVSGALDVWEGHTSIQRENRNLCISSRTRGCLRRRPS